MKNDLFEFTKHYLATVTRQAAIARVNIQELMVKEDLYMSFLKLQGEKPSDDDCAHFKSLTPSCMKGVNDLLISGYPLNHIKQYSVWKGK